MASKRKEQETRADESESTEPTRKAPRISVETSAWLATSVQVMNVVIEEKRDRDIIVLRYDTKVKDALEVLQKHDIDSAPVTATGDALHTDTEHQDFFFGLFDVYSVLRALFEDPLIKDAEPSKRWEFLRRVADRIEESKCMDVISGAGSSYFAKPMAEASLRDLIQNGFFKGDVQKPHPAHSVIAWEHNKIQTLITQTDVIKYIWHHKSHLGDAIHQTVHQLGLEKPVDTVSEDVIAIDAFHQMYLNDHSCLGVVDKEGKLVDNISQSDLRGLTTSDLGYLAKENVERFLARKHKNSKITTKKPPVLSVRKGQHFKTLLEMMVDADVNRVFIVDTAGKPVGVVTSTDILYLML